MKKVFSIIAVAVVATAFVACGPSAEEKAKMEARAQQISDSINQALEASMQTATEPTTTDSAAVTPAAETATPAAEVKK